VRAVFAAVALATLGAPVAYAAPHDPNHDVFCVDDAYSCPWGDQIDRWGSPSVAAGVDVVTPGNFPAAGPPGTWQVFAVPPNSGIVPGIEDFCGIMPVQQPAPDCPAGWDYTYR